MCQGDDEVGELGGVVLADMRDYVRAVWCGLERRCGAVGIYSAPDEECEEGGCHLYALGEGLVEVSLGDGGVVCGHRGDGKRGK